MQHHNLHFEQYTKICPFFEKLFQEGGLYKDKMSSFWKRYLDYHQKIPTFNEIEIFRRTLASGIGYGSNIDEESEFNNFLLNFGRAKSCVPIKFIIENQESNVGLPYQYCKDGILSSSAGLHNCVNAYYILEALKASNINKVKNVLEIGAGYGGAADILIRNINPDIYIICDLPQNLFLSAYYLSVEHPKYHLYFIDKMLPDKIDTNSLVFCTPGGIELINEELNLVVNTYSFQEMIMTEVERYFNYIDQYLSDNGLFYFLNHYGVTDVERPSDYPFNLFDIKRWGPAPNVQPEFLHRKQHLEVLLRKGTHRNNPPNFENVSYILSLLTFMGLNLNIIDTCNSLVQGKLSKEDLNYLATIEEIVCCCTPQKGIEKMTLFSKKDREASVTMYVAGLLYLFKNNYSQASACFTKSINTGLIGFAKSKAYIGLGLISQQLGKSSDTEKYFAFALENTPQFEISLKNWNKKHINIESFKKSYKFAFPKLNLDSEPIWKKPVAIAKNAARQSSKYLKIITRKYE